PDPHTLITDLLSAWPSDSTPPEDLLTRASRFIHVDPEFKSDHAGKSLGERLYEAVQAVWPANVKWADLPTDFQAQYERAAVSFTAKLSDATGWEPSGYEGEVIQGGDLVAGASGESLHGVQRETAHYAAVYGQDGPVEVKFWVCGRRPLSTSTQTEEAG
ncbi:hypothetical protein, partial [Phenylobacterium sp.]|uniref:hypothetical protein n=1 Tax=Phenylobacterium sp. TaxID=1871053 RepID=UPI0030F49FB7